MHGKHLSRDKSAVNSDSLLVITIKHPHKFPVDAIHLFTAPSQVCVCGGGQGIITFSIQRGRRKGAAFDYPPLPVLAPALGSLWPCLRLNFSPNGSSFLHLKIHHLYLCPLLSQGTQAFFFSRSLVTTSQEGDFLVYFGLFYI